MIDQSDVDWAAIRAAYVKDGRAVSAIAKAFGISRDKLYRRARKDNWPKRRPKKMVECTGTRTKTHPSNERGSLVELPRRLRSAVERQLSRLEAQLDRVEETTSADQERETRALGSLIRNFEKLTELEAAAKANAKLRRQDGDDGHDDDQERFRRRIEERIVRLRERLSADT